MISIKNKGFQGMDIGFAAKYTCNVKPFLSRGTMARTIAGIESGGVQMCRSYTIL